MDKIKITGIGIIGLLLVVTGTMYFTPEQLDNTYYCTATEQVGIFYGGISATGLTAYPYKENRSNYERCKNIDNGVWIKLKDYADEQNISIELLLNINQVNKNQVSINYNNKKYECVFSNKIVNESIESYSFCKQII